MIRLYDVTESSVRRYVRHRYCQLADVRFKGQYDIISLASSCKRVTYHCVNHQSVNTSKALETAKNKIMKVNTIQLPPARKYLKYVRKPILPVSDCSSASTGMILSCMYCPKLMPDTGKRDRNFALAYL